MLRRFMSPMAHRQATAKKRVLFLRRTTPWFGGSDVVVLDLLKAIDYETTIVLLASSGELYSKVCADLKLPVNCLALTAPFSGGYVRMLASWLQYLGRLRPDKIILAEGGLREFPVPAAFAAFAIARGNVWMMELAPAPALANEKFRLIPLLARERVRSWLARGVLSVSQGVKDRLVRIYGYAPKKVGVVYNGVDTKRFSPPSEGSRRVLREGLQIPDEAVVLVSTARLDPIKRLDRLIRAFDTLSLERGDLWLLLTGDGPEGDDLRNLVRSIKRRDNVRFLGFVEDVRGALWASDVYVLPSEEEGFGIALAEAMACKLVCVATATIGPSEIIDDGVNGFLTEVTYEGVLKGMRQALALSREEREAIGNRARDRILANFRVEQAAARGLAFMRINSSTGMQT